MRGRKADYKLSEHGLTAVLKKLSEIRMTSDTDASIFLGIDRATWVKVKKLQYCEKSVIEAVLQKCKLALNSQLFEYAGRPTEDRPIEDSAVRLAIDPVQIPTGPSESLFSRFHQAPPELKRYIQSHQFRALVEERSRGFVGRESIFKRIDSWSSGIAEFPSGYIVITGEPGIGKTALASRIVDTKGCCHYFNISTLGIGSTIPFLENVCAQIMVRYQFDGERLPERPAKNADYKSALQERLIQLLSELSAKPELLPITIVVDALDEAGRADLETNENVLSLPPTLPTGVFMIVTTRNQSDQRLIVDRQKLIALDNEVEEHITDVKAYISLFCDRNRQAVTPILRDVGISEDELIQRIAVSSEGNFMYLVHVLPHLLDKGTEIRPGSILSDLPVGLNAYYERHWRQLRHVSEPNRFEAEYEPVVAMLAAANESISVDQLCRWAALKFPELSPSRIRDAISIWREFLNDVLLNGISHYHIYHKQFQEFLKRKIDLGQYDDIFIESTLSRIRLGPNGESVL